MLFYQTKQKRRCGGFTLIELLVVVLIIGILAAVAVPQYEQAVIKSRFTELEVLGRAIFNAEQVFYLANGYYTDSISDLDISLPAGVKEYHSLSAVGEDVYVEAYAFNPARQSGGIILLNKYIGLSFPLPGSSYQNDYCFTYSQSLDDIKAADRVCHSLGFMRSNGISQHCSGYYGGALRCREWLRPHQ